MNKEVKTWKPFLNHIFWVAALAMMVACDYTDPMSTFDTHGPVARDQLVVFWYTLGVSIFLFITVGSAFLYAVFRFRARPGEEKLVPQQTHGNAAVELVLIMASIALLVVIAIPNLQVLFAMDKPPADEQPTALKVEAIGHQWWWEFKYPDLGITTANELHVPVNRAVEVTLSSVDVIHSFWIPKLAGKMDVMPGAQKNYMWFKGEKVGAYNGQCMEFCGESHANMRFMTFVDSSEDFDKWVAAQQEKAAAPADPLTVNGQDLFQAKGCTACHAIKGTAATGTIGPDLTHFGSRTTLGAALFPNDDAHLRQWLTAPEEMKPGNIMNFKTLKITLSKAEMDAIAAYLQSLK